MTSVYIKICVRLFPMMYKRTHKLQKKKDKQHILHCYIKKIHFKNTFTNHHEHILSSQIPNFSISILQYFPLLGDLLLTTL